jgi:hypothetical protein
MSDKFIPLSEYNRRTREVLCTCCGLTEEGHRAAGYTHFRPATTERERFVAENAALRAEVERLKSFYPNAVEIAARADRYRKALEDAPHADRCAVNDGHDRNRSCDCRRPSGRGETVMFETRCTCGELLPPVTSGYAHVCRNIGTSNAYCPSCGSTNSYHYSGCPSTSNRPPACPSCAALRADLAREKERADSLADSMIYEKRRADTVTAERAALRAEVEREKKRADALLDKFEDFVKAQRSVRKSRAYESAHKP